MVAPRTLKVILKLSSCLGHGLEKSGQKYCFKANYELRCIGKTTAHRVTTGGQWCMFNALVLVHEDNMQKPLQDC